MSTEDRLRNAYDELGRRATRDAAEPSVRDRNPAIGRHPGRRPGLLGRPGLAIAALAVIAAGGAAVVSLTGGDGGNDSQEVATEGPESTLVATPAGDDGTTSTDTGDGSGEPDGSDDTADGDDTPPASADSPAGSPLRVATAAVSADVDDPFLNVRTEPGAGASLLAKLPPTYTGIVATGRSETTDDGGTWIEVELGHPVAVTAIDPGSGRPPAGWVNAAFVEELPDRVAVGTDEIPACAESNAGSGASGGLGTAHVYGLESAMVSDDCLRIVLTFGPGRAPFEWRDLPSDTGPAAAVARVLATMSGGLGVTIDLGPTDSAWTLATETADGVYVTRQDDGSLELVIPTPARDTGITALPDRGIVVIDLRITGRAPASGGGVVLTQDAFGGRGAIDVTGLARPFEANLGVEVVDAGGNPVEAVFSGNSALGTRRATEYGVATNDWTEAWGRWALRVEDLAPGTYTIRFDAAGGVSDPETFDLEFTIDEAGDAPTLASSQEQAAAQALADFGRFGDGGQSVPLADEVILALGPTINRTATAAELADVAGWTMASDGFAEAVGPFNPLALLDDARLRITAGPVPWCAGPPRDWPTEFDGLRQVNLEPIGIDSCIQWFGVHLFLDDDDRIAAVALDLFGP